jgi:hypothetical protein
MDVTVEKIIEKWVEKQKEIQKKKLKLIESDAEFIDIARRAVSLKKNTILRDHVMMLINQKIARIS